MFVVDEQHDAPVDLVGVQRLAEHVLGEEGVEGAVEVNLLFVDRPAMADLNATFMDAEGPTDVLAFPIDESSGDAGRSPDGGTAAPDRRTPEPEDMPLLLGDVVICPAVAAANAHSDAGRYEDEIRLLVVHGLLHLMGMDHAEPEEAVVMQGRERELLAGFAAEGEEPT